MQQLITYCTEAIFRHEQIIIVSQTPHWLLALAWRYTVVRPGVQNTGKHLVHRLESYKPKWSWKQWLEIIDSPFASLDINTGTIPVCLSWIFDSLYSASSSLSTVLYRKCEAQNNALAAYKNFFWRFLLKNSDRGV